MANAVEATTDASKDATLDVALEDTGEIHPDTVQRETGAPALETIGDSSDTHPTVMSAEEQENAAKLIQRNYRGYRDRRSLAGHGLSPESRWTEALKDARYRTITRPRQKRMTTDEISKSKEARGNWRRLAGIVAHAGGDNTSSEETDEIGMSETQLQEHRRKRLLAKKEREKSAKTMGLEYFLEMVDVKHRYGSHLRTYHKVWSESDSKENFFYWLDWGDGLHVNTEKCSREKLDQDQVRYLSREERMHYLVKIDDQGRLRWAKNGDTITTTADFKDSSSGIVPVNDRTLSYRDSIGAKPSSSDSSNSSDSDDVEKRHTTDDLHNARGVIEAQTGTAAPQALTALVNKKNKKSDWIFVVDTSFRIYIGIKESGAFQHSSFLKGSRILSAGLISAKHGQIRSLSPHSGHYRPTAQNFRALVRCFESEGVDMSRVSTTRSYAILLGSETYAKSKKKVRDDKVSLKHQKDKIFNKEEARKREEAKQDKSESAKKEREFLARQKAERKHSGSVEILVKRLSDTFRRKSSGGVT